MKWCDDSEYQLMCEKAEEIQKEKEFICLGDWYFQGQAYLWTSTPIYRESRIWLPSQEDLQEMVKTEHKPNYDMIKAFRNFFVELDWHEQVSMNCLWLAFVMHELYQKEWNPEKKRWEEIK